MAEKNITTTEGSASFRGLINSSTNGKETESAAGLQPDQNSAETGKEQPYIFADVVVQMEPKTLTSVKKTNKIGNADT